MSGAPRLEINFGLGSCPPLSTPPSPPPHPALPQRGAQVAVTWLATRGCVDTLESVKLAVGLCSLGNDVAGGLARAPESGQTGF